MSLLRPVLLVEDDPDDAELIQRALLRSRLANPVVRVGDGVEAMEYLEHSAAPPLFVLLDIKLPRMDGHEVLAAIRAQPALALTPVVMLTSSAEERDRLASYRNGANAYVIKPVDFSQLQETVATLGYFWGILNCPPPPPAGMPAHASTGTDPG